MATSGQKKTRSKRVAALELPPGQWERALANLRRRDVLFRIALGLAAAVALVVVLQAWDPPFSYHTGHTPPRDIVARASFDKQDPVATAAARNRAESNAPYVYANNPDPLVKLRASLRNTLLELTAAREFSSLDLKTWLEFHPPAAESIPTPTREELKTAFERFHGMIAGEENLAKVEEAVAAALAPFEQRGLLDKLAQEPGHGSQEEILVHPVGQPKAVQVVPISEVLIGDATAIHKSLVRQLESAELADRLFAWLRPRLQPTLSLDMEETRKMREAAAEAVESVFVHYEAGQTLAKGGESLGPEQMDLLRREYEAFIAKRPWTARFYRATAMLVVNVMLLALCALYLFHRRRPLLVSVRRLVLLLALAIVTVAVARWVSRDGWRVELIPLLLFGQIAAITYRQELALVLTAVISLIVVLGLDLHLAELLLLMGTCAVAILQLGRIRSRGKLIYVGCITGAVAFALTIGVGLLDEQPIGNVLVWDGVRNGLCAVAAGFLMTGLLPFVEPLFGVLTDMSLLELGDVAHPLLQELVRRAPSTYNHSLTVGSIAEAAAEAIGARGLLVRVGAYYHDIGKMLKPGYFIENQGDQANRHEQLMPAMSTLVIIAHIKDGANLARQHHLPQAIIDFIQQHHGTMLVGYFYDRASRQSEADPDSGPVEESAFRYPGPKPQTKETGVLMLADAIESASRTLVDPTPARIENLVREVAEQRLKDGQFDESGLTLRELRTVENSLIKSLIAIYHGRVKYPDQRTA